MPPDINFDAIYQSYFSRIHAYLVRLVGPCDAEDAAQDVFNKASRKLDTLRDPAKVATWLYRIATHTAIDKTRSLSFRLRDETPDRGETVRDGNVWTGKQKAPLDQRVIKAEMRSCIQEFIGRIPDDYRAVLILKDYENRTDGEIAEITGTTLSTAKIRYHRAKQMLKKELESGCEFFYDDENQLQCDRKQPDGILKRPPQ